MGFFVCGIMGIFNYNIILQYKFLDKIIKFEKDDKMFTLSEKVIRHDPQDESRLLINLPVVGEIPYKGSLTHTPIEKQLFDGHNCAFDNNGESSDCVINLDTSFFGTYTSGRALVTIYEMGYDLTKKTDLKRIKNDKTKIKNKYDILIKEKPELFDENNINEVKKDNTQENDEDSLVTVDFDKFNNKKTIYSAYTIRYTIAKKSCEKIFRKVAGLGISLDAYIDLTPRLVDTKDLCIIVIDVHYGGNDWIFLDSGKMVVIAGDANFQFQPKGDKTDVKSGMAGNISEDVYYPLSIQDFEALANAEKIELQISGKSSHVEFETNLNTDVFGGFYNAVFDGDEPIMDKNDVIGVKKAAPAETPSQESQSKSEEVDVEKELEKLKGLLDKGLITQEAYDAKMNQLLGL